MGKAKKESLEGSGYASSIRCVIIIALAAVPYFLWPMKISRENEDANGLANASVRTPSPSPVREPDAVSIESTATEEQLTEYSAATDPVTDVLRRIRNADFQGNESVMTGRYLKVFQDEHEPVLLETTDLDQIRLLSRGDGWMFLEAPFTPDEERYGSSFPWDASAPHTSVKLRMVMVERDGDWKLEDVKVVTRP